MAKKTDHGMVIVAGMRTPFTKADSLLASVSAQELGRITVRELIYRTGLNPKDVDELIFGCVGQPADAANVARVIALSAGLPEAMPASTVHRNCASGFEALTAACSRMHAGHGEVFIVGGTESMSHYPLSAGPSLLKKLKRMGRAKSAFQKVRALLAIRPGDLALRSALMQGLTDPISALNMGQTAEKLASEFGITRDDQDRFSMESHHRAERAGESGRLRKEITPVFVPPRFDHVVENDNGIRRGQSMAALAKLRTIFRRGGTVTAGSASQITDGAVALLVMTEARACELGMPVLARIRSWSYRGCDPARMGLGPAFAIPDALERAGLSLGDMGVVEINEAFAAQVLSCVKALSSTRFAKRELNRDNAVGELNPETLNINGGAIALGHPLGATGARLLLTTAMEMRRRGSEFGLASLCIGGGQGGAIILEAA